MRYNIWTIGCQMNVSDSRRLAAALERLGYTSVERPEASVVAEQDRIRIAGGRAPVVRYDRTLRRGVEVFQDDIGSARCQFNAVDPA